MANHPSAEKRNRQRIRQTERNRAIKSAVRTIVKATRTAITATGTKKEERSSAVSKATQALDRAASKGAMHPKTASRRKGRLARAAYKASVA